MKGENAMTAKLVVGVDGTDGGKRAFDHAIAEAKLMGDASLVLVCVIEWSPYSFNTPEENAERHQRREDEISLAQSRVLDPIAKEAGDQGIACETISRHGDAADIINDVAEETSAVRIIVARKADGGIRQRLFGSVAGNLVQSATVAVTIVP